MTAITMTELHLPMHLGDRYLLRLSRPVSDSISVMRDIRMDDVEEWAMSEEGDMRLNLENSIRYSAECYTVASKEDGAAHIIWGVVDYRRVGGEPLVWLLGTNQGQQDCAWILQMCRGFAKDFLERWPNTACFSAPENLVHHRWLEWMGYRNCGERPWGPFQLPFIRFERYTEETTEAA